MWRKLTKDEEELTGSQQLGDLALHEAQLADKHIQDPAKLQAVGICC